MRLLALFVLAGSLVAAFPQVAVAERLPPALKAYLVDYGGSVFARSTQRGYDIAPHRDPLRRYAWAYGYAVFDGKQMRSPISATCPAYLNHREVFERSLRAELAPVMALQIALLGPAFEAVGLTVKDITPNAMLNLLFAGMRYRCKHL